MITADTLKEFLYILLGNVPTILAYIVAIIVVLGQGPRIDGALPWALTGFALGLFVSVEAPLGQVILRGYIISHAMSFTQSGWMFSVLGVFNSTLHAAALIFLLVAVFAGRMPATVPPPLPRV